MHVSEVDDANVHVVAWGTPARNPKGNAAKFAPVKILHGSKTPVIKLPRKDMRHSHWIWQIPIEAVDELCVLRDVGVLESGKLSAAAKRAVQDLPASYSIRHFAS